MTKGVWVLVVAVKGARKGGGSRLAPLRMAHDISGQVVAAAAVALL